LRSKLKKRAIGLNEPDRCAVDASGKTTAVDLRDIYARAKRLGAHVTPCEY
jgi:hypothetical protein